MRRLVPVVLLLLLVLVGRRVDVARARAGARDASRSTRRTRTARGSTAASRSAPTRARPCSRPQPASCALRAPCRRTARRSRSRRAAGLAVSLTHLGSIAVARDATVERRRGRRHCRAERHGGVRRAVRPPRHPHRGRASRATSIRSGSCPSLAPPAPAGAGGSRRLRLRSSACAACGIARTRLPPQRGARCGPAAGPPRRPRVSGSRAGTTPAPAPAPAADGPPTPAVPAEGAPRTSRSPGVPLSRSPTVVDRPGVRPALSASGRATGRLAPRRAPPPGAAPARTLAAPPARATRPRVGDPRRSRLQRRQAARTGRTRSAVQHASRLLSPASAVRAAPAAHGSCTCRHSSLAAVLAALAVRRRGGHRSRSYDQWPVSDRPEERALTNEAKKILVAPAWPYASGPRHIGHVAGFAVPADVFARYHRLKGNDVLMVSGTDEHGTPVMVSADRSGVSPRELADRNNELIRDRPARPRDLVRLLHAHDDAQPPPRHAGHLPDALREGLSRRADDARRVLPRHGPHAARPLHRGHVPDLRLPGGARRPVRQLRQPARPGRPDRPALDHRRLDAGVPRDDAPLPRPAGVRRAARGSGSRRRRAGGRTSRTSRSGSCAS